MEVSDLEVEPDGTELIQTLASLTGLPESWAQGELLKIIEQSGLGSADLTLTELRKVLAAYLEEIHTAMDEEPAADN